MTYNYFEGQPEKAAPYELSNAIKYNTRAAPDVPELVIVAYGVDENNKGKPLVRYDQAAEIIAAKDKEIEGVRRMLSSIDAGYSVYGNLLERAEAAEAKLAQYEAQEPIGYLIGDGHFTMSEKQAEIAKSCTTFTVIPLYASPTPAADLKAENERLREALTKISSPTQTAGLLWWQVEARAALNVEASHDKG